MRLKIRWKLLILFLIFALLPLLAMFIVHRGSMRKLAADLGESTRDTLIQDARRHLLSLVEDYARILRRDQKVLTYNVLAQAREAEFRLHGDPPANPTLFLDTDYDEDAKRPPGMEPSTQHFRLDADGRRVPVFVTYDEQVFYIPRAVDRGAVEADMARLSTMKSVYEQLHTLNPKLLYWQYTSLESGLHSCYPGHGGYPDDYDPRVRPWYIETKKTNGLTWIPPTPEVSTGTHTMAVCMPLRSPDGKFLGATAIDIPLEGILDTLTLPKEWAVGATKVFVYPEPEFLAQGKLAIIASRTYQEYAKDWREKLDLDFLETDRSRDMVVLVADALGGKSAVRTMDYRGQRCLWAYVGGGAETPFPVVIVPYNRIVAQAAAAEGYVHQRTLEGMTNIGYLLMALVVVAVVVAFWRSRHFTRPIRRLASAAESLAAGNYETRVDIRTGDELQHLGDVVNALGPQLEERQRMKQALALAVEIQQHLLPTGAPSLDGFDISGHSVYCDETGGDYYDFIELVEVGPGKLGVAIGDVTGHGIGAALLMASARAVLRSHAGAHGLDLAALFARLNDHLVRDTGDERFMTLFYGVLDAEARTLTWTSGGHDPALWLRRASGEIGELPNTGIPLGIMEGAEFGQEGPVTLQKGDIVLIGTDGIWETANAQGEEFGKTRLREILAEDAGLDSASIRAAVVRAVADFRADGPQEDDITLVVIKAV